MRAEEMLDRLDEARRILSSLPPDTSVLRVEIDGLGKVTGKDFSYIHIGTRLKDLGAESSSILSTELSSAEDPKREYVEDRVRVGGFHLVNLRRVGRLRRWVRAADRDGGESAPAPRGDEDGAGQPLEDELPEVEDP